MQNKTYCYNIWNNSLMNFDSIKIYYKQNDEYMIQVFSSNVLYPSQTWFASEITICYKNDTYKFYNMFITFFYDKQKFIIE